MRASLPNKKLALKHNISEDELIAIYKDMFTFIKDKIQSFKFSSEMTREEFDCIKKSFVIPKIGKLGTHYDRFIYLKTLEDERSKIKENQTDVYSDCDNG